MLDPARYKESLYEFLIDRYQADSSDLNERWRSLDAKAQGTATIAGVFLAGIFAFIKDSLAKTNIFEQWLVICAALALAVAIALVIWTLRITTSQNPPLGRAIEEHVRFILEEQNPSDYQGRLSGLRENDIALWKRACEDMRERVTEKAVSLWRAQIVLLLAITVVLLLTCGFVLGSIFS